MIPRYQSRGRIVEHAAGQFVRGELRNTAGDSIKEATWEAWATGGGSAVDVQPPRYPNCGQSSGDADPSAGSPPGRGDRSVLPPGGHHPDGAPTVLITDHSGTTAHRVDEAMLASLAGEPHLRAVCGRLFAPAAMCTPDGSRCPDCRSVVLRGRENRRPRQVRRRRTRSLLARWRALAPSS